MIRFIWGLQSYAVDMNKTTVHFYEDYEAKRVLRKWLKSKQSGGVSNHP